MSTVKDVLQAIVDLDVHVKIVKDPNASMSVTKDGVITVGEFFLEKMTPLELNFAIQHEYAHIKLGHFHRIAEGEHQIQMEYEADRYATEKMQEAGHSTCKKLDNIESLRPLWDTTHPSKTSLRGISCDAGDGFVGGESGYDK
jgi:Zn-dependent protease with chaperone function